jgi:hypothetical protein
MTTEQAKRDWAQDLTEAQIRTIRGLGYIDAIRRVREWTGWRLAEARNAVDRHRPNRPLTLAVPTEQAYRVLLEDINACGSEALTALQDGRLSDVRTDIQALLDIVREAITEIEESQS